MSNFFIRLSIVIPGALLVTAVVNSYREGAGRRRLRAREAIGFEVHKWW